MEITVHVHMHEDPEVRTLLHGIFRYLKGPIMTALTDLQSAVAAEGTVVDSAVTLLQGLKAALDEAIASGDPKALAALSADIGAKTTSLSDAVVANTPAATPTTMP